MTITWLTCIDNNGFFMCSLNKNRFSAQLLLSSKKFVLNVPVSGMEQLVLNIGGCSGRNVNKFKKFNIPISLPGCTKELSYDSIAFSNGNQEHKEMTTTTTTTTTKPEYIAVSNCVAHMICQVESILKQVDDDSSSDNHQINGHYILLCKIDKSFVRSSYWDSKRFKPMNDTIPPYLTFLGSQSFAYSTLSPSFSDLSNKEQNPTNNNIGN
eukprot:gene6166-7679_t